MHFFLILIFVALCVASVPGPLTSYAGSSLYGHDCSEWCVNGSAILQPTNFGDTNAFCTDPRGCFFIWRLRFTPCSLALLDFEAEIGSSAITYSQIDPAASRTLNIYCTTSSGTTSLEVRSVSSPTPMMQWRYASTDCLTLLNNLASHTTHLVDSTISLQLDDQEWFASGADSLLAAQTECGDYGLPCEQCFAGTQLFNVANNASVLLQEACGTTASEVCSMRWSFCYNACSSKITHVAVKVGTLALAQVVNLRTRDLDVRIGQPDQRGSSIIALTDSKSVQDIDEGRANFFLAWEERVAPPEALWRSPRRDALFMALYLGLETRDGTVISTATSTDPLGFYAWDGQTKTGIEGIVRAASHLSSTEKGLIASTVVLGVFCVLEAVIIALHVYRHFIFGIDDGTEIKYSVASNYLPLETGSHSHKPSPQRAAIKSLVSRGRVSDKEAAKAKADLAQLETSTHHLTMSPEELARQIQLDEERRKNAQATLVAHKTQNNLGAVVAASSTNLDETTL